ncbi:hypothetical protein SUNI508_12246 [Seiridium unicorne]|uniref:Ubiquitin-like domain-containing protein n=1 Tax=Seiridium unicorne TaxID=138068 RepID=A0ABR2UEL8_9PEZI
MSATFTYGSFGDLITTVQLVWRLSQALSDSYGSAQEFQDLVVELNLFYGSLHELMKFWQTRTQGPELESLISLVKPAVAACRNAIESFLQKAFKKYGKSLLRPRGSRKSIFDMIKRIQWSIFEKDKMTQMRDLLRRNKDVIDMVQSLAQGITQEQDSNLVAVRLASLADAEAQASARVEEHFGNVLKMLREQATTTARIDENVITILSEVRQSTKAYIQSNLILRPSIPGALDPYAQSNAFIEDALGYTFPIPLGINPSWETVRSMIRDQFRGRGGMELVMREKYLIQDLNTGEDLRSDREFYEIVRTGQTLTMAMILSGGRHGGMDSSCPKCGQVQAVKSLGMDTTCNNSSCSFIYRRVLDVSDATDDQLENWLSGSKNTKALDRDLDTSNEGLGTSQLHEIVAAQHIAEGPDIFKRVRFITRWEDLDESRGSLNTIVNGIHFWAIQKEGWAGMARFQISVLMNFQLTWQQVVSGVERGQSTFDWATDVAFVGYSKKTSVLVAIVYSEYPMIRRRAWKTLRNLAAFKDSRIRLLVIDPLAIFSREDLGQLWATAIISANTFRINQRVRELEASFRHR